MGLAVKTMYISPQYRNIMRNSGIGLHNEENMHTRSSENVLDETAGSRITNNNHMQARNMELQEVSQVVI